MDNVGSFDVFNWLINNNDKAIKMAPLENISHLKKVRWNTQVTIGVSGNEVSAIYEGKYVGGLILCDRKRYYEVKAQLEAERVKGPAIMPAYNPNAEYYNWYVICPKCHNEGRLDTFACYKDKPSTNTTPQSETTKEEK